MLDISKVQLIAEPDRRLEAAAGRLNDAAARRLRHEPVSRILGAKEFYGRSFKVTPDVLDPRPDTETIVDLVLDIAQREHWRDRPIRIADIGTGSGAILLTLLAELPLSTGTATDISKPALDVAAANANLLGVADRVRFVHTPGLSGVRDDFDLIVSNPPYIATSEIAALEADVRDHDPLIALDGGTDGLLVYQEIANDIMALGGSCWAVLELGAGQLDFVRSIFTKVFGVARVAQTLTRTDLGGHVRAVAFRLHHRPEL